MDDDKYYKEEKTSLRWYYLRFETISFHHAVATFENKLVLTYYSILISKAGVANLFHSFEELKVSYIHTNLFL